MNGLPRVTGVQWGLEARTASLSLRPSQDLAPRLASLPYPSAPICSPEQNSPFQPPGLSWGADPHPEAPSFQLSLLRTPCPAFSTKPSWSRSLPRVCVYFSVPWIPPRGLWVPRRSARDTGCVPRSGHAGALTVPRCQSGPLEAPAPGARAQRRCADRTGWPGNQHLQPLRRGPLQAPGGWAP